MSQCNSPETPKSGRLYLLGNERNLARRCEPFAGVETRRPFLDTPNADHSVESAIVVMTPLMRKYRVEKRRCGMFATSELEMSVSDQ
jgi:hypothetical protein